MKITGVVSQQIPYLYGASTDIRASSLGSFSGAGDRFSGKLPVVGFQSRKFFGGLSHGFRDNTHLLYYYEPRIKCGEKKEKVKEKEIKKRAKLIKGLTKDLNMFSNMGFSLVPEAGLVGEVQNRTISEATDILLKQLEQLRAEEKELKKQRKEEKAKAKAMKMKTMMDSESSSSSSESSNNECDQVIDMNRQRNQCEPVIQVTATEILPPVPQQVAIATLPAPVSPEESITKEDTFMVSVQKKHEEGCNGASLGCYTNMSSNTVVEVPLSAEKRIEVCMGGKCKRSGGAVLLEEFQRVMGDEGSVVGCKCMGKCKNGPNVRIVNQEDGLGDSLRTPANALYIGVGLQDVSGIVSGLFGEEHTQNMDLAAA